MPAFYPYENRFVSLSDSLIAIAATPPSFVCFKRTAVLLKLCLGKV